MKNRTLVVRLVILVLTLGLVGMLSTCMTTYHGGYETKHTINKHPSTDWHK